MDYSEVDANIYALHEEFHDGAFVNCRQCRALLSIVDTAIEVSRTTAIAETRAEYAHTQNKRGRPSSPMPPLIDASPEEIARTVLSTPPKRDWRYLNSESDDTP